MYLTIHATAGALIGSYVDQPFIAFLLGFISHFLLDILPHHDGNIFTKGQVPKSRREFYFNKVIGLIYFDLCLAIIVAGALFTNNIHFLTKSIIWGIIGGILPDIIQALNFFWYKNKFLQQFNQLHNLLHYSPRKPISVITGHVTQLITLIILINPLI